MKNLTCAGKHCIRNACCKFTLIELLIVIAIIAILAGMLLPALGQVREMGRKAVCISNNKQIMTMFGNYTNNYNGYIPPNWHYVKNWYLGGSKNHEESSSIVGGMYLMMKEAGLVKNFFLINGYQWNSIDNPKFIWCPSVKYRDNNNPPWAGNPYDAKYWCLGGLNRCYMSYDSFCGGYAMAIRSTRGTYGLGGQMTYYSGYATDGVMDSSRVSGALYMTKVKRPSRKAYLSEMISMGYGGSSIPGAGGSSTSTDAAKMKDYISGRHNGSVVLGYLDGHVSAIASKELAKNDSGTSKADKILGEYYD